MLSGLKNDPSFMNQVVHWEKIPARPGVFADFPRDIHPDLCAALKERGIEKLYSHQAACYDTVRGSRHAVVVTPTASGKTLCYNLPVMQGIHENPAIRALYLFPTKALSQDQQAELNEVSLGGRLDISINTYDGDTPSSLRTAARKAGQIIISNPDMLHAGILPNHPKWIQFFTNLAYVVIDEIHTYRGVFGSHMANLIRRLKRVAAFYGSRPLFICCSATIGNPLKLAETILGESMNLVDNNGSPSGEKELILYNPPLVDRIQGIRRGVVLESQKLGLIFLKEGVKTIIFARSRIRTELIASYVNKSLANMYTDNYRIRVESYRGGYLPGERREIEKGLRTGEIQGVVSTSALELGIDIGGLDCAILAGFPGSVASAWQQAGRAGRRNTLSAAVFIASSGPGDQYIMRHPEYFLSASPESGFIDPDNLYIQLDHLKCALFELPMKEEEEFGPSTVELLRYLEEQGVLRQSQGTYYWADRGYPAEQVSLRTATSENVVIIDTTGGGYQVIGEMDLLSAKELIYKGAVYLHRGEQFFVTELDIENKKCFVEETDVNFYTDAVVKTDIKLLQKDEIREHAGTELVLGDVLVRRQVAKYKKLKYHTHENIGYGDIFLPEDEMHTRSFVMVFSPSTEGGKHLAGYPREIQEMIISRLGGLFRQVAPIFLLCDTRDLGIVERLRDPHFGFPALFLYDNCPGGTGLAEGLMEKWKQVLAAAEEVVLTCPCETGCPSCIGPLSENPGGEMSGPATRDVNPKEVIALFLRVLNS